jgi:hypothetical protein
MLAVCGGAAIAAADPDDLSSHRMASQHTRLASKPAGLSTRSAPDSTRLLRARSRATTNIYSHTLAGMLAPATRRARYLVYVPDSQGNGVYVINPSTYRVVDYFATGAVVQHVVPAWDLRALYATNDVGNSLTPIDPNTGRRAGPNIPVADPYNMYFTPDGAGRDRRRGGPPDGGVP